MLQRIDIGLVFYDLREQVLALVLPIEEGSAGIRRFWSVLGA